MSTVEAPTMEKRILRPLETVTLLKVSKVRMPEIAVYVWRVVNAETEDSY
jgi:hypothetical protein